MDLSRTGRAACGRGVFVSALRAVLAALFSGALGGCAAAGADVHVAPLYSRTRSAGGGVQREALFGLWSSERDVPLARYPAVPHGPDGTRIGLRPLYSKTSRGPGRSTTYLLPPLGRAVDGPETSFSFLFPLYLYTSKRDPRTDERDWQLILLGSIVRRSGGETTYGSIPFYGGFDTFLTYDDVHFVLFPLYVTARKGPRRSHHFLFPILGFSEGGGEKSFRLWPLYGYAHWDGRYDRWFALWPFFHRHEDHLGGGSEVPETKWMVFPLIGGTRRGTFRSTSVLWPFFGYSSDSRNGFRALDAPWPLVRLQRGGENPAGEERTRAWPFYSHLAADGLDSTSVLWPLYYHRYETYAAAERESLLFLPFYQGWTREDVRTGERSSWRLFWPLWQRERNVDGRSRTAFPALSFLGRSPFIEYHLAWAWELFAVTEGAPGRSERSFAGLWRRERDEREDRASLAGLWARRRHRVNDEPVRETSLLFGLLRWRASASGGVDWMRPAFPGPGWPRLQEAP